LAVACLLLGGWWLLSGVRSLVLGLLSRGWEKAEGVIRKAKVMTSRNSEGDDITWQELEYSYSARGRSYRGTRIRIGVPRRVASLGQPLHRRGDHVAVYYSPSRPALSVLRTGWTPFVIIPMTAGAGVAWVGIRLLF
jgi:hypothetical protein